MRNTTIHPTSITLASLGLATALTLSAATVRADELTKAGLLDEERQLLEKNGGAWTFVGYTDVEPVRARDLAPTPYTPGVRVYSEDDDRLFGTHEADEGDRAVFVAENGAMFEKDGPLDLNAERLATTEWFPEEEADSPEASLREKKIFGSDNRSLWGNTTSYPARAHVALRNGSTATAAFCSGAMIGPRHLLTAGHCLYKNGSFTKSRSNLRVVFGQDGSGNSASNTPYGKRQVVGWIFPKGWIDHSDYKYDYALLILSDSTFSPGWLGFAAYSYSTLDELNVNIVGYPGHGYTCAASPRADKKCGGYLYADYGRIKHVFTGSLYTKVDWQSGQSGSPVYRYQASSGGRWVVGVVSRHSSTWNKATRMRSGMFNALCDWIGDFPSSHFGHDCQ